MILETYHINKMKIGTYINRPSASQRCRLQVPDRGSPRAIVGFVLERDDIATIEHLHREQAVVGIFHGDSTMKVRLTNGEEVIVHIEGQMGDSQKPMLARLA